MNTKNTPTSNLEPRTLNFELQNRRAHVQGSGFKVQGSGFFRAITASLSLALFGLWTVDSGLWTASAQTPVLFSTYNFTGQVLNNPITVTPLDSLISDSQNLYAGPPVTLQPVAGIAATNLMPGDYRVVIQGVGQAWTITVPATTNLQNAAAIPKLGVLSQNVFFWTNALAGVNLTLNFTNAQDQFAGTWIGAGSSLAASTNEGFRVFPAYAPFPAPGFLYRPVGLDDWGPSSLNDLAGDTVLMAGTNNVVVIRDSAGNDLAYFSSTNGGTPKLAMAAYGGISASSLPVPLQSLATNNASSLTNLAALSIPDELWVNTTNGSDANSGTNWSCAKATLLGAYDSLSPNGGTIHFADGSWVGSNSGQGIWLMGSNDPNWGQAGYPGNGTPVGANGWRALKGMTRWVGHGGTISSQWGFPAIANLLGGGGIWLTNTNMPALWFSDCSQGISFENTLINNCPHPLRIGPNSALNGVTFCSQFWFLNSTLRCPIAATDDGQSGPTAWFETSEATHFQNCNFQSYATLDGSLVVTNNRHAAILCNIMADPLYGAGNFKIVDSTFFSGGIKYYTPQTSSGGFVLDGGVLECGSEAVCPPLAWIIGETYYYIGTSIRNCVMWDGYFYPGMSLVQIDSTGAVSQNPSDAILTDTLLVNGPATVINNGVQQTGMPTNQPSVQRQAGIAKGRFWGMTDAFRRNFAPATVVVTNQVPAGLPASCTNAPDPTGGTNAFASTVIGAGIQSISLAAYTYTGLSAGDFYVFGAWVKLGGTNQIVGDAGALFLSSLDGTMRFDSGYNYVQLDPSFQHNDWQWLSCFSKVVNQGAAAGSMIFAVRYYTNRPVTVYSPVLMYVPAGTMGSNSVAELANHFSQVPPKASQGSLALIPGQQIALWDTNSGTWYYLGVTNGILTVPGPVILNGAFTNLTVTSPVLAGRSLLLNGFAVDSTEDPGGIALVLNKNSTGNRQLALADSGTGYALRVLPQSTVYLDGYLVGIGEEPIEFQSSGSLATFGGPVALPAGSSSTLALRLGPDEFSGIYRPAAGGLALVGGADTFTLNNGGLSTTYPVTVNGFTNKDSALFGASVLGMDANGKMIVGSTSGGATISLNTNGVPVNAAAAAVNLVAGSGVSFTASAPGSTANVTINSPGGGGSQTNSPVVTPSASVDISTNNSVPGATNYSPYLDASQTNSWRNDATNAAAAATNGTVHAAVTAQNVIGGSGAGVVIVPNGAGNPGILLGGTNAGVWASNIVASTVTSSNGFTGNLTGTASGNDASGAALNATNGLQQVRPYQYMSYGVAAWGDSLTAYLCPTLQSTITNRLVFNGGVTGNTSTQIKNRMLADSVHQNWPTTIWAGANNPSPPTVPEADIASMMSYCGSSNVVILGVLVATNYPTGTSRHTDVLTLNSYLAATYPNQFTNIHTYLESLYNPSLPQDVIDYGNDVTPASLRADNIHLNNAGWAAVSAAIAGWAATHWTTCGTNVLTVQAVYDTAANPPPMGPLLLNGDVSLYGSVLDAGGNSTLRAGTAGTNYSTNLVFSLALGPAAGQFATNSAYCDFLGSGAGQYAFGVTNAFYAGQLAGEYCVGNDAILIGYTAGQRATNAARSIMMGHNAGAYAPQASYSVFMGYGAGEFATNGSQSIYMGYQAGQNLNRAQTLAIDMTSTGGSDALIYGEFDNRLLRINGQLQSTGILSSASSFAGLLGANATNAAGYRVAGLNDATNAAVKVATDATNSVTAAQARAELAVTGTVDGSHFLRDDWTLAVPPGGSGQTNLALVVAGDGTVMVTPSTNNGVTTFSLTAPGGGSQTNSPVVTPSASVAISTNNSVPGATNYSPYLDASQTNRWRLDAANAAALVTNSAALLIAALGANPFDQYGAALNATQGLSGVQLAAPLASVNLTVANLTNSGDYVGSLAGGTNYPLTISGWCDPTASPAVGATNHFAWCGNAYANNSQDYNRNGGLFVSGRRGAWVSNFTVAASESIANYGTNIFFGLFTNGVATLTQIVDTNTVNNAVTNDAAHPFFVTDNTIVSVGLCPNIALPANTRFRWVITYYPTP